MEKIDQMMSKIREQNGGNGLVPIYTVFDDNRVTIKDCIEWMSELTGITLVPFAVKMLDKLFMRMVVEASPEEFAYTQRVHIKEDCRHILNLSEYIYMPEIACKDHVKRGRPQEKTYKCSRAIVLNWTYNLLKKMSRYYDMEMKENSHYPKPETVPQVGTYKIYGWD